MNTPAATESQHRDVATLRRYLNYMNDAGLAAAEEQLTSFLHRDIEWRPGMLPYGKQVYRGHDEYRQYVRTAIARTHEGGFLNVDDVRAVGENQVLAVGWVHYVSEEGPTFDSEYALLARFEDGLIKDMRSFLSRAEAERAAEDA